MAIREKGRDALIAIRSVIPNWDLMVADTAPEITKDKEFAIPAAGKRGGDRKSDDQMANSHLEKTGGASRERRIAQLKKMGRDDLAEVVISGDI